MDQSSPEPSPAEDNELLSLARIAETERRIAFVERLLDRPIFIAGRGRSGTSLLLRLFDNYPPVFAVARESRLFTLIAPELKQSGDYAACKQQIGELFLPTSPAIRDYAEAHLDRRFAEMESRSSRSPRDLMRIILELSCYKGDPARAQYFLEKTPKNEEHLGVMFESFPSAKVIYVVRDPRAVYLSNSRSEEFRMEPAEAGHQWAKSVRHLLKYVGSTKAPDTVFLVRYEDLVTTPRKMMRRLCNFLGLEMSGALVRPTWRGRPWLGNSYAAEENTAAEVKASKAHDWCTSVTKAESDAVVSTARFEMTLLNYPIEFRAAAARRQSGR